jgi:hypothetical protein
MWLLLLLLLLLLLFHRHMLHIAVCNGIHSSQAPEWFTAINRTFVVLNKFLASGKIYSHET